MSITSAVSIVYNVNVTTMRHEADFSYLREKIA